MPLWALSFEVRHRPAVAELVEPYGIQDGVDVGKMDFLAGIPIKIS